MNSRKGVLALLNGQADTWGIDALTALDETVNPHILPRLDITIKWNPRGPVMVKADAEGLLVDMLPLASFDGKGLATVIPGSSVKGVLRSQSERIWRTVTDCPADNSLGERDERFNKYLQCDLVETLYGAARKKDQEPQSANNQDDPMPGLSALGVEDCYSQASNNH